MQGARVDDALAILRQAGIEIEELKPLSPEQKS
jgi:hypothetical protein